MSKKIVRLDEQVTDSDGNVAALTVGQVIVI